MNNQLDAGNNRSGIQLGLLAVGLAALAGSWLVSDRGTAGQAAYLLSQVAVISLVIWQACDPFAAAAQVIGTRWRLPGSVRGATLDAIASSMPELLSGIFFVVVAFNSRAADQSLQQAGGQGFGNTVATCAGSAVYNMILIPAICALVISYTRLERPTIDVESKVISRDGLWFLGCQSLLVLLLFQDAVQWWFGLVFIGLYFVYIFQLYLDARAYQHARRAVLKHVASADKLSTDQLIEALRSDGINPSFALQNEVRQEMRDEVARGDGDEEVPPDYAGVFFGLLKIPLNHTTAWLIILCATLVAAGACWWLVNVTEATAHAFQIPTFFVAVILAAAASSVPDTFLSIGAARRGDDSGAVSNAFGSNVFDICICISIPLLVSAYLTHGQPVEMLRENGEAIPGIVGLRILMSVLTIATLLIMWHNRQLTRFKAFILFGLYGLFVAYAVAGSLGVKILGVEL